jgi:acyl-CoA-binding protein
VTNRVIVAPMSLSDDFESAQQRVNALPSAPSQDKLLQLYGLYKQAKLGDVDGKRPGMLDLKGRAKYDAWAARKGTSKDDAMQAYIALVDSLSG